MKGGVDVSVLKKLVSDLHVYSHHNRGLTFLYFLSLIVTVAGSLTAQLTGYRFSIFGFYDCRWIMIWFNWLIPALSYLLIVVVSAFFLIGPGVVYPTHASLCFAFGFQGYSCTAGFGFRGFAAQVLLSGLFSLTILFYCSLCAKSMALSSMIRSKMFGNQRALLYPIELRRFLILAAVSLIVTLAWTACTAAFHWLLF